MSEILLPKHPEYRVITEGDISVEGDGKVDIENHVFDRVAINIGGAPLLGSLYLSFVLKPNTAIVTIDPLTRISRQIYQALNNNEANKIPSILNSSNHYDAIPPQLFNDVAHAYRSYWLNYLTKNSTIYGIRSLIDQSSLEQLNKQVDTIACYYPPPVGSIAPSTLVSLSSELLQTRGYLEVFTERNTFRLELLELLRQNGFDLEINGISESSLTVSLYDIIALEVFGETNDPYELLGRWHILAKKR